MAPCGTAEALTGVLGILGLLVVRWSGQGLFSPEAPAFWRGTCGSYPLGLLGPVGPWCRYWGPGRPPWVLVLLVSVGCGRFLICCSKVLGRSK